MRVSSRNAKAGWTSGRHRGIDGGAGFACSLTSMSTVARAWASSANGPWPLVPSSHGVTLSRSSPSGTVHRPSRFGGWGARTRARGRPGPRQRRTPPRGTCRCDGRPAGCRAGPGSRSGSAARPPRPASATRRSPPAGGSPAPRQGASGPTSVVHVLIGDVQGSLAHGTAFPRVEVEGGGSTVVCLVYQVPEGGGGGTARGVVLRRPSVTGRSVSPPERAMRVVRTVSRRPRPRPSRARRRRSAAS